MKQTPLAMLFNSIFGRKNSVSSTSCQNVKLKKKNHQPRHAAFEPLESRDLLTVTTGLIDNDAYDEIRAAYPDFNLPKLQADLNVMTITPDDGALSLADLKSAIATAGTTDAPDLILVQTSADVNSVTYASAEDEVLIDIDSSQYGSITIIGWGDAKFTLDANQQCLVMNISNDSAVVNLGGLRIQNGVISDVDGGIYNHGLLTITNCYIYSSKNIVNDGILNFSPSANELMSISCNIYNGAAAKTIITGSGTVTTSEWINKNVEVQNGTLRITSTFENGKRFNGQITIMEGATLLCSAHDSLGYSSSTTNIYLYGTMDNTAGNETFKNTELHLYGGTALSSSGGTYDIINTAVKLNSYALDGATQDNPTISTISAPIRIRTNGTFEINTAENSQLNIIGEISTGTDGNYTTTIAKLGQGTLYLGSKNTFKGDYLIKEGVVICRGGNTSTGAFGSGTITVESGATLDLRFNNQFGYSSPNTVTIRGTLIPYTNTHITNLVLDNGVIETENDFSSAAAGLDFGSRTGTIKSTGNSLIKSRITINESASATFDVQTDALTVQNSLKGSGKITKTGRGALILTGNNESYTGKITVSAGKIAVKDEFWGNLNAASGGTLSPSDDVGNLTANGNVTFDSGSTGLFEFGAYNADPALQDFDTLTISETGTLLIDENAAVKLNFKNNDAGLWASSGAEYKLISCDGFVEETTDMSNLLGKYQYLFNLEGRPDGLYLIGAYDAPSYPTVVTTLNDSLDLNDDEWSLREAIYYAPNYVDITFADGLEGTINLSLGQLEIDQALSIDGDNRITIDAQQNSRVFSIDADTDEYPVSLNGLTIQNGKADAGAGIYIIYGTVSVSSCLITGNTATTGDGGGINNQSGILTISQCTISDNTVLSLAGGGVANSRTVTITDSSIVHNTAQYGGGVNNNDLITLNNVIISDNSASKDSGGVRNWNGTVVINDCTIERNTAELVGGGIYSYKGNTAISNSKISLNKSSTDGGGIRVDNSGSITIRKSVISNNIAIRNGAGMDVYQKSSLLLVDSIVSDNISGNNGGGIAHGESSATIKNSVISRNIASNQGGGVWGGSPGSLIIENSTLSANSASIGGGVYAKSIPVTVVNSTISGNSAVSGGSGIYSSSGGVLLTNSIVCLNYLDDISGSISSNSSNYILNRIPGFINSPIFNTEGVLINSDTMDLHLRSDSIAIDNGDNSIVSDIETDLDGNVRIFGDNVDIGAYEYQGDRNDEPILYSNIVNTLNDSFNLHDDEWSLREAIYFAPEYVTITFADNLEGSIDLSYGQLVIDKALVIDGDNRIVINANQQSRVFNNKAGSEETPVILQYLVIQNGKSSDEGGGILNKSGYLKLINCAVCGNNAITGGGIYNYASLIVDNSKIFENSCSGTASNTDGGGIYNNGTLAISNSEISNNVTTFSGGGIFNFGAAVISNCIVNYNSTTASSYGGGGLYNYNSNITISNCEFKGNTSHSGGGIKAEKSGMLMISDTYVSNNISTHNGGGMDIYDGASLLLVNSVVSNNASGNDGGGIAHSKSSVIVKNSVISRNSSVNRGGGIYDGSTGTLILENSALSANSASTGGGIHSNSIPVTLTNCTISGNAASSGGSGIYKNSNNVILYNSIVSSNYLDNISGALSSDSHNYIIDDNPGFVFAPYFNSDGELLNAESMNLYLRKSSAAIDTGDNSFVTDIVTDLDGLPRIIGEFVDIGAYEYIDNPVQIDFVPVASVQSNEYSNTNQIPQSEGQLTDWDYFYLELWTANFNQYDAGDTFDAVLNYNPNLFQLDSTQLINLPNGVTAEVSDQAVEDDGTITTVITLTVSEDGFNAPGINTFWGSVLFTPSTAEGSGVPDALTSTSLGVSVAGLEPDTTLIAMPFDLERNNAVDIGDFIAFASVFGYSSASYDIEDPLYAQTYQTDFDGSGVVDVNDFITFAANFGMKKGQNFNIVLPQRVDAVPAAPVQAVVNELYIEEDVVIQTPVVTSHVVVDETVVTILEPEYFTPAQPAQAASVQTLHDAHSSALLDLYDNQNCSEAVAELSAPAIDEALYQDDEFDFLFDESDSDADDNSDVDLSTVLDELELELI